MFDILFTRTFLIVGAMLLITSVTSRINKSFETATEMWVTVIATFVFLFASLLYANIFPLNLIIVGVFSALIGWEIGPTIEYTGKRFQIRKYLKSKGVKLDKNFKITQAQQKEFEKSYLSQHMHEKWRNVINQALTATTLAVFVTAGTVFLTNFDFSFLQGFLFMALLLLIIMGILNTLFFKSRIVSLLGAYFGAVIFTFYLLFDFNRLEKMAGDESWATAIEISVSLYLDIINLFLDLLTILAEQD